MGHPACHVIGSTRRDASATAGRRVMSRSCFEEEVYKSEQTTLLGWSVSALVHGVFLAVVAVFSFHMAPSRAIPQKEPFRWEVSLLAAPKAETMVADGIQPQEAASVAETDPGETTDARSSEQVAEFSTHPARSVRQEEIAQTVSFRQRTAGPVSASDSLPEESDRLNHATIMPAASPAGSVLPPPEVESQYDSNRLQVETQLESPTVLQRPQSVSRPVVNRTTLPDYTWLMDTLRTKLERVKVYPPAAKANHSQGRVVVQISVLDDGRIANPEIEESSGHPVLDQAALDALRAASPLTLGHRLEATPIVMLVPLNYQLE